MEGLHGVEAVARHAGDFVDGESGVGLREGGAHAGEEHHELGEDYHFVAAGDDFSEGVEELGDFAGVG